jgi:predicted MPP superfamily phosphohydrolase
MHVYVFLRIAGVPVIRRHLSQKCIVGLGIALWTGFYLGRVYGHHHTGVLAVALEFFGMNWMAVLFLLFTTLLALDIATGFGLLLRRHLPSLRGWALAAGGLLSLLALIQGLRPPVTVDYAVYRPDLPIQMDGKTLVAMSDLHLGALLDEQWLAARIDQTITQKPDMVVLLGDIFEGHDPPSAALIAVLSRLTAPLGVWAVLGNHEFHGDVETTVKLLQKAGIQVLRNRWVEVKTGFFIGGVDDLTTLGRSGLGDRPLKQLLAAGPRGTAVLLSHTPWYVEQAADAGVDLMLCAHTHGGQIWPFSYLVRTRYPLLGGRYEVNGMTVLVSRGTGTWGPRMRLWRPGEILRVTLHRKLSGGQA